MKQTNTQRGMKKWQPFNALEHYSDYINSTFVEKTKIEKPVLSNEQIEDLNYKLTTYNHDEVTITHFKQGEIILTTGIINKIDVPNQILTINKTRILFTNLIKIELCF